MDMDESVPDGNSDLPEPDVDLEEKIYVEQKIHELGKDDDTEYSDDEFYEC